MDPEKDRNVNFLWFFVLFKSENTVIIYTRAARDMVFFSVSEGLGSFTVNQTTLRHSNNHELQLVNEHSASLHSFKMRQSFHENSLRCWYGNENKLKWQDIYLFH